MGRLRDGIDVHAVRTGTDNAAKTACAERKRKGEAFFDLFRVVFDGGKLGAKLFVEVLIG